MFNGISRNHLIDSEKPVVVSPPTQDKEPVSKNYDLPPVMEKKLVTHGMASADYDILKAASSDLFKKKKDTSDPYAEADLEFEPLHSKEHKTMRQLMEEKLKKEGPASTVESVEDRKARLRAQRDLLLKQKEQERKIELEQARDGQTNNKYSNSLFNDLLALDKKVNQQENKKKHVSDHSKRETEVPEVKPSEDDEAEIIPQRVVKKDMKSLFADSDDENEEKKQAENKARQQRNKQIIKNIIDNEDK